MKTITITPSYTPRSEESIEAYLNTISRMPHISPDEEADLTHRIHQGDHAALDRLVKANLRFVVSVAKTYQNQGLPLADLIEEGNIGLVKAAQKFDETRGFKFISYAVWWIRQSITEALTENSRMVRLPSNQSGLVRLIKQAMLRFEQTEGRPATVEEIADELDMSPDRVHDVLNASNRSVSFDAPLVDEDGGTLLDVTPDQGSTATDAALESESLHQELEELMRRTLKERDIYILRQTFGIGCSERTQEEVSLDLGLTRERVRQIRERAIQKLRNSGETSRLRIYCG